MADAAKSKSSKRNFLVEFCVAGVATSGACVFSNPMEVVKTRMQLQGELARDTSGRGPVPTVRYRNFAHGFVTICAPKGCAASSADCSRAWATSGRDVWHDRRDLRESILPHQARIQAASSSAKLNAQYAYKGMIDGFVHVLKTEGFFGLYRGVTGAVPRVVMGSAAQLSTYTQAKSMVMATGVQDGVAVQFGASFVSGFAVATAMNPMDVVSTRLYSQRFYKGWTAQYFRIGPHTVFTFLFWEKAKAVATSYGY
ncbi:hypothetical protein PINS_up015089 [Pythium insidiosum]|nr:hypothetical protein PINS_up015089 [Pythium insidiosum]